MKKFRLKKDAVPFFKEKYATAIYPWDVWEGIGVDTKALEEVNPPYLTYGIERGIYTNLGGWNNQDGKSFEFTIHFPDVRMSEHDRFSNGRITRGLMNRIQDVIDNYFSDWTIEESTPPKP